MDPRKRARGAVGVPLFMTNQIIKHRVATPPPPASPTKLVKAEEKNKEVQVWTPRAQQYLMILSILCFMTRCFKLNDPQEVVFDEVHFGGFASNYLRREYFFDVHPPLGKLIIAATGWLSGYDGSFTFASIGLPYAGTSAPFTTMRFVMAAFGWATMALSFATLLEMGFSLMAATFAASLIIFGKKLQVPNF